MYLFLQKELVKLYLILLFSNTIQAQMIMNLAVHFKPQFIYENNDPIVIEPLARQARYFDIKTRTWKLQEKPPKLPILNVSILNKKITILGVQENLPLLAHKFPGEDWKYYPVENDPGHDGGFPSYIYEFSQSNYFFGMGVELGMVHHDEASCCAWYKKSDAGKVVMSELINLEFNNKPLYLPLRDEASRFLRAVRFENQKGLFPLLDYPIRVPGAFVVVSWQAGILWIIRDGDFSPSHVIDLDGVGKQFASFQEKFPPLILDIQPMKDGRILIARRSKDCILEYFQKQLEAERRAKILANSEQSQEHEALGEKKNEPLPTKIKVIWEVLDPIAGTIKKSDVMGTDDIYELKTEKEANRFSFGFDQMGNFIYPMKLPPLEDPPKGSPERSLVKKDPPSKPSPKRSTTSSQP